ncbi:outer membrane protein assembly factor BamE [Ponticoccus sp. (in: a-proteobacteria)]|uniref:outer membrane protein assembly factor BamE n=1 Tax=Ponticoccus sp. (in: a-proteobacteria) TaxID=1925025 RepID=UPI003AB1BEA0
MQGKTGRARLAAATVMVVALGACSASYRTHGYMPPEDELQQIVPGVDTQASVEDLIGVPNASGVRDNSGFYYIETEMRHFAWRRPEIMDRQILAITFDQAGIVDNISTYGLEDGRVVPITRRVTKSTDGEIGFIRKLFGNIGGLDASQLLGGQ